MVLGARGGCSRCCFASPQLSRQPALVAPARRWAWPQLTALTLFHLQRTPILCASPALYHGCGLEGAACITAHTAAMLGSLALLGVTIHRQELAARLAWAAQRTMTRARLQAQLAAQPLVFWFYYALPSVWALVCYNYPLY